jgi:nitroimidazol reductase NimA-like FMN-containing flavoprotein (pyridoxamine 5'-phosphate oxidase superfamily)
MLGELAPEHIERILHTETVGRIGCHADGRTYVVPITYAYDGNAIYGHSAEGLKLRMMRANPQVCFEIEQVDDLANWRSVIAWATFEELHGAEAERAMQLLVGRLMPLIASETSRPLHPSEALRVELGGRNAVAYRLRITEKTGRFEERAL